MRLLLFSLLLISSHSYAQLDTGNGSDGACTEATLVNGGTFNCTSLTLSATPAFTSTAGAIIVKVQGNVTISNPFNISGTNGTTVAVGSFSQVFGGDGGPGAGDGGGEDGFNTLFPGLITDATTQTPDASPGRGEAASSGNVACGDGGGGGGFKAAGTGGSSCGGNGPGAAGGAVSATSIFSGTFRGGFGGGAGGDSTSTNIGSGGGGGGALHIIAGGDISITGAGSILANGGNGGDGAPDGGGGGAGSGGVIWLQSLGNIDIAGSLSVTPGNGVDTGSGGVGGNGGVGFIRLEDADGVITGGGSFPGADVHSFLQPVGTKSLKSDISCGSVKKNDENHSALLQMFFGFGLVAVLSYLRRRFKV